MNPQGLFMYPETPVGAMAVGFWLFRHQLTQLIGQCALFLFYPNEGRRRSVVAACTGLKGQGATAVVLRLNTFCCVDDQPIHLNVEFLCL
jgi:hypothetical protein